MQRKSIPSYVFLGVLLGTCLAAILLHNAVRPVFRATEYIAPDTPSASVTFPFVLHEQPEGTYVVKTTLQVHMLTPRVYAISADDCLQSITVNGQAIVSEHLGYCDFQNIRTFNLGSLLRHGSNEIVITATNSAGATGMHFQAAQMDLRSLLRTAYILFAIWMVVCACIFWRLGRKEILLCIVVFLGIAIRFLYVEGTPYEVRSHDTNEHIDYIEYIAENLRIPPSIEGWEYHQAPLYYEITGIYMRFAKQAGVDQSHILIHIQFFSLVLSIIAFIASVYAMMRLFPLTTQRLAALTAISILATFPSIVFLSSRITNDSLFHALAMVTLALGINAWQTKSRSMWYAACIAAGFSIITKTTGYVLLPPLFLFPLLYGRNMGDRARIIAAGLAIIIVTCGWVHGIRAMEENKRTVPFGDFGLSGGLMLPNTIENFIYFNPIAVVNMPYNHPFDDGARRQHFWEYLYRSALSGEFTFADNLRRLSRLALVGGYGMLLLCCMGIIAAIRQRKHDAIFIGAVLVMFLAGIVAYRLLIPCSCNQDYRFITPSTLSLAYFATLGASMFFERLRYIIFGLMLLFACLCGVILLLL